MRAFCVTVAEADEDQAVAALWGAGTTGIEVRPAPGGRVRLVAYFEGETSVPPVRISAPGGLPAPSSLSFLPASATIEPVEVEDVDWVARFRAGFHAFRAGRFLVAPAWDVPAHERDPKLVLSYDAATTADEPSASDRQLSPDTARSAESAASPADAARLSADTLIVDPGRAFGTGTHETTRLCLAALESLAERRPLGRVLDLGAGTGLLAVAAVRLGAPFVCASDVDSEATASSRHHARLNGAGLHVVRADGGHGFRPGSFDLVLANLMALLLVDRAAEIRALLAPGGALVLSGLLVEDVPFVRDAFARTASPANPSVTVEGEWAALVYEDVP